MPLAPPSKQSIIVAEVYLNSQVQEAPKPIDDEALLEYKRRIDSILEETAESVQFRILLQM